MAELTADQAMQKLLGEFRTTIRADLRRMQAEADLQTVIDNKPTYQIITTRAQFEEVYTFGDVTDELEQLIRTEQVTITRNSKRISEWLSVSNFATDQLFRIPFDDDTSVDVRIIQDANGRPTIDHSLNPESDLYTP